jgi:hypothetical protein
MATSLIGQHAVADEGKCRTPRPLRFPLIPAPAPAEKPSVHTLLDNTARLLDTASAACLLTPCPTDYAVFIGPEGGLQMVAGAAQSLPSLAWTHGARCVWQVSHRPTSVRVEGWQAGQRCVLESPMPAPRLVADLRLYSLAA